MVELSQRPRSFCTCFQSRARGRAAAGPTINDTMRCLALESCPPVCSQSRAEGALLLDPTADEAAREEAGLTLAIMPACSEVRLACGGADAWHLACEGKAVRCPPLTSMCTCTSTGLGWESQPTTPPTLSPTTPPLSAGHAAGQPRPLVLLPAAGSHGACNGRLRAAGCASEASAQDGGGRGGGAAAAAAAGAVAPL